jgi:segregation and condensation protein A
MTAVAEPVLNQNPSRVSLLDFEGPLDLLLQLVRQEKKDIFSVDLSEIAARFLAYVSHADEADLEECGEFMVTCSELMVFKSRKLLPREERPPDEEDPVETEQKLKQRLADLAMYQAAAIRLQELFERRAMVFTRPEVKLQPSDLGVLLFEEISSEDLMLAARRVALEAKTRRPKVREVATEKVTVREKIAELVRKIKRAGKMLFSFFCPEDRPKEERVASFLAILEMARRGRLRLRQPKPFAEIEMETIGSLEAAEIG